ncbi:MAG: alpha-L-fucosidase [Oscillospiraceae bacterium]|nr:alpha-L-fucosidase [Oscillospiraceae bacterium]
MLYEPNWRSLRQHAPAPQWLKDAKFGIYTHWGIYSVPACGPNGSWYGNRMYCSERPEHAFHLEHYGDPAKFGYKDFIPMFTAERFDPDQWAELFAKAGARFAGPVAEHHDGFSMWNTSYSSWNAATMGPRRDVVAELEQAYRARGLKFLCALHHFEHWGFFQHWTGEQAVPGDRLDPRYAEFYGRPTNGDNRADQAFLDRWLGKTKEVIDRFSPDALWFDFGLRWVREDYKRAMIAHYFNHAVQNGQDPCLMWKGADSVVGSGVVDLELGRFSEMQHNEWITDSTIDDSQHPCEGGWGYVRGTKYKSADQLIHYLIDNVSKNGYMLLNVGPKPDGTIPEEAERVLLEIGRWLAQNGEAIYETTPWLRYGEGPTKIEGGGGFNEHANRALRYTARDFRFTVGKDNTLYATALAWDDNEYEITRPQALYPGEIKRITMLGTDEELSFKLDGHLHIAAPKQKPPVGIAYTLKIERS